jgi:hypothetical protein
VAESSTTLLQFRQDIETDFRRHIREALEVSFAEEITAVLGPTAMNGPITGADIATALWSGR